MLVIKDILISDRIFEEKFHCNLDACKGACCWEGDYGAPVYQEEKEKMEAILPIVKAILPEKNQKILEEKGATEYYKEPEKTGTSLMPDASCAYLLRKNDETGKCAFEVLYEKGMIDFKKPISCELYPIRLIENIEQGFIAMNFDDWDICQPACVLGKKKNLPVFRFLKAGIIRKFGQEFYDELESYYEYLNK